MYDIFTDFYVNTLKVIQLDDYVKCFILTQPLNLILFHIINNLYNM